MKKVLRNLFGSAMLLTAVSASAQQTYVVYSGDALKDNETQITSDFYIWEGTFVSEEITDETAPDGKCLKWTNSNMVWFGGGYQTNGFDMTQITQSDYDLCFSIKTTYTGDMKTQFNDVTHGVVAEPVFNFTRDGQWQEVRINLKEAYPAVVNSITSESSVYCFALVGYATEATDFYITDVRFEPAAETGGEDPVTPPVGTGSVWYGSTEQTYTYENQSYTSSVTYSVTYNEDATLTVKGDVGQLASFTGFVPEFNIPGNDPEYSALTKVEGTESEYTVTSTRTFTTGETVTMFFWLKYAGGVARFDVPYTVGASNEPVEEEPKPTVTASAVDVTETSAVIKYSVALPQELAGAAVSVKINDVAVEYTEGENSYAVTDLASNTQYDYSIVATATLDGKEYVSSPATVSFKTLSTLVGNGNVWHGTVNGEYTQEAGNIPFTVTYSVRWNEDATLTVNSELSYTDIVGLVVRLNVNDVYYDPTLVEGTANQYTFTTPNAYAENEVVNFFFYLPYAGGDARLDFAYTVGSANEPVDSEVVTVEIANVKASEVTATSAAYSFDIVTSAAAVGKTAGILLDGEEIATVVIENTTTTYTGSLTELEADKDYTFTLNAVIDEVKSEDAVLTFSTLGSDPAEATILEGAEGYETFTEGWAPEIPFTASTSRNNTIIFSLNLPSVPEGLGMIQVNNASDNSVIATLYPVAATATEEAEGYQFQGESVEFADNTIVEFYFYMPYAGGGIARTKTFEYQVGGNTITGINAVNAEDLFIGVIGKNIVAPEGAEIYSINGQRVDATDLASGVYVVRSGKTAKKVIVK